MTAKAPVCTSLILSSSPELTSALNLGFIITLLYFTILPVCVLRVLVLHVCYINGAI